MKNKAPKKNDEFYATLKKNEFSKTLVGEEAAGRVIGPFECTKVILDRYPIETIYETKYRQFHSRFWTCEKC